MEKHDRLHTPDHRPATGRNLLLLGLWMRSAFVGAAIAAAGFASLIDPPQGVPFLTALTWIVAGGTFAWLAWQRTATLLDRIDAEEPTRSDWRFHHDRRRPTSERERARRARSAFSRVARS